MTQGNIMNPTNTPAAIVAEVPASKRTVVQAWREQKTHDYIDHAFYALARLNYSAHREDDYTTFVNSSEFVERCVHKLVRTFSPSNRDNTKPFSALVGALNYLRRSVDNNQLFGASAEEAQEIRNLAGQLYMEARALGDDGLRVHAVVPPVREKKPYVRPSE